MNEFEILTRDQFVAALRAGQFPPGAAFQTGFPGGLFSAEPFNVADADPDDFPKLAPDERVWVYPNGIR